MLKIKFYVAIILMCLFMVFGISSESIPISPFPIGIFNPPSYSNTTFSNYETIKNMNVSYVLMGNGINDFTKNDAAITQANANGLKVFIDDTSLRWTESTISQNSMANGYYVSSSNSLGQTFIVPDGKECILNYVQLFIDFANWNSGVTLTLSIYDSPSKSSLIGQNSISGQIDTYYPYFYINKTLTPGLSYYWELTSNSSAQVGWVCSSSSNNPYTNGTAYQNGNIISNYDFWFNASCSQTMYNSNSYPSNSVIDSITEHYGTNTAVAGYNVIDEPIAYMFPKVIDTIDRFRSNSPSKLTYVNLMPDYYIGTGINSNYGMGSFTGAYVTALNPLGQTFTTNSITNTISTIQIFVDYTTWSYTEGLTLKLWNSPSKTSLIAQSSTIYGGISSNYPIFTINANVSPNTSYYWELVHSGGGNNSIGWVVMSSSGVDWEKNGTGYNGSTQLTSDFWFTVNQNIAAFSYEDYVYRWAKLRPDFIMQDCYPFMSSGSLRNSYFYNLEVIRRQSLSARIPFQSYIQACGITNDLRIPTVNEMRYQIYTSIAYGCQGYNYFLYWTPNSTEGINNGLILSDGTINTTNYNGARDINAEVLHLGSTLQQITSQSVYHTGTLPTSTTQLPSSFFFKPTDTNIPTVIGFSTNDSGRKYIIVVNRDYNNSRTISFMVNPKPTTVKEISKSNGSEINTNYNEQTGNLSQTFSPGEGRVFVLPIGY